ncbi:MAG: hypothetical protein WCI53_07535 [Bacteroidota bacterium]|jgi:hypothetical protein
MKNKNLMIATAIALTLAASCTKLNEVDNSPNLNQNKATSFKTLKVSDNFNWNTSELVKVNVSGLNTLTKITNTMIISSEDQKTVYYTANIEMSNTFVAELTLPKNVKNIKVSYGSISKVVSINGNTANFDYLTPVIDINE